MKSKILLMVITAVISTGCVSTNNISVNKQATSNMKNKTIVTTLSTTPDFAAMTADKAAFGMFGASAMISSGNEIVKNNDIQDPAYGMGEKLVHEMAKKNGINVSSVGNKTEDDSLDVLTKMYANSDYILDVRTINWSFAYFPTDWDNYRVIYSTKLRLIEVDSKTILAEGFCSQVPDQTETSPTYDELLADNAKRLKEEIQISSEVCLNQFRKEILSL